MLSLSIVDIKGFMAELLKGGAFDGFGLHSLVIHSFACFEIHRPSGETELKWSAVRPFAFDIVKSGSKPKSLKVVFMMPGEIIDFSETNLFLNVNFEADKVVVTTGLAQKNFSVDKTPHRRWNEHVLQFFNEKNIAFVDELL
jgi:hypothetical protein